MAGVIKKIKEKVTGDSAKRKAEAKALASDMVRADSMRPEVAQQAPMTQEMMYEMGRIHHLLIDEWTLAGVMEDDQLKHLVPAFSHVGRTTRITAKQARIQMLEMECLFDIHTMNMDEDEFDHLGWAKLKALEMFGKDTIYDKIEGHRGKLITEKIKIIEARVQGERKKGLLRGRE